MFRWHDHSNHSSLVPFLEVWTFRCSDPLACSKQKWPGSNTSSCLQLRQLSKIPPVVQFISVRFLFSGMFKFAKCTKCGRGECGMAGPDSRRSSTTSTASSENAARVVPVTKPRPQSPTLAAAALVVKETKSEEEEVSQKTSKEDLG